MDYYALNPDGQTSPRMAYTFFNPYQASQQRCEDGHDVIKWIHRRRGYLAPTRCLVSLDEGDNALVFPT